MSDLSIFILINGHEIIGKVISEEDTYYLVDEPFGIQMVPMKDSASYGLQLVPFCAVGAEGKYNIYKHAICAIPQNIPSDIEKAYVKQTSKIQLL
jgi:hypothetical protein